jgi:4-hydroxybenzoate polyprenyltransferase
LGWWLYPHNGHNNFFSWVLLLVLSVSVWLAWIASVVPNDIYDYQIDLISNNHRPLQKKIFTLNEYQQLGWILFILSLIGGLTINFTCAAILVSYQIIAWFYSSPPYRLKRFPIVATFFSSLASLLMVFLGFSLFSGEEKLTIFPWRIGWLLLISLTLSLPIKDFRDQEGDKRDGVFTLPVLLGQDRGRMFVGVGIFLSFMLSAFFLNEKNLFWWAMLFGGVAFWLMNAPSWRKKVTNQNLVWWILGLVSLYGVILVEILFIKK